jgi:branched-subunit amino acid transport protein AzlD
VSGVDAMGAMNAINEAGAMDNWGYIAMAILVMGLVTLGLRAAPFLAAKWLQKHDMVLRLGKFLPLAIMVLLTTHTLVGNAQSHEHGPWPEVAAGAVVVAMQLWRKQALLSIVLGVLVYVALRNQWLA